MSNFAYRDSFDYNGYPYDLSLPKDLCREENQLPDYYSLIGENPIWRGNEGTSGFQVKFNEPKDDILVDACEDSYLHQDYRYDGHEPDFTGFHSEPLCDAHFPMVYHGCPEHAMSSLRFYQPYDKTDSEYYYDRISHVWSTSAANLNKLPYDFHKDFVEGKCISKGYHSEGTSHEAKNFGSYFGRSNNSNSMEKDPAHIFENNVDHFNFGHNAPGKIFEDFPQLIAKCADNLAQTLFKSSRKKQNTAEPEEIYNHQKRIHRDLWELQLEQAISSLTAYVVQLEIQVEHLTHQVQDMADKLSGEKRPTTPIIDHSGDSKAVLEEYEIICNEDMADKLSGENKPTAPILDHSGDSKTVLEESKIISSADETTESKLFIETEDSSQKPDVTGWIDVSYSSASDWEIV